MEVLFFVDGCLFFTRDLECFEQVADIGCGAAQVLCYFVLIGIGMFCHIASQFFFVDTFRIAAFGAVLQRTCFLFKGNPLVKGSVGNAEGACGLADVARAVRSGLMLFEEIDRVGHKTGTGKVWS